MAELTLDEVGKAVDELRKTVEAKSFDQEKVEKINKVLDSYEEKNQELVKAHKQIENHEATIKEFKEELEKKGLEAGKIREQVDALEIALAKSISGNDPASYRDKQEYKALHSFVIDGSERMPAEYKAELRTDGATEGGVLVIPEMEMNILKNITEIDPIRSIARVRPISSKSLIVPIEKTIPVAQYEGEAETSQESVGTYGSETLTAFRLTHTVPITRDMLMDSSFNMEAEIMDASARAFAFGEGNGFVLGTGFKQPTGFLNDPRIGGLQGTGGSGAISADDPIRLQGELKTGYSGTFVLNRRVLANLRTKKSTDGVYLWQPGLNGPAMATLSGDPYIIANSMPDLGGSAKVLAYGDFGVGYLIVDRTATEVIRDDYTRKKDAIVEYTIHRWNTGKVVLPEAIKVLTLES